MSISASDSAEIPYKESELKGKPKAFLVGLVARQSDRWPGPDSKYGFTKPATPPVPSNQSAPEPETNEVPAAIAAIPSPNVEMPGTPFEPTPPRRIKLYIEDRRGVSTLKTLHLAVIYEDCGPDHWQAELHNLLVELQDSNSALTGPVKISCRDPEDPDYWMPFVKVADNVLLEEAETSPEFILIPNTNRLEILVEHAQDARLPRTFTSTESHATFDINDPETKPLEVARSRSAKKINDQDAEWLKEPLKITPGYQEFKANQHKVQTNPGVVVSWLFIANFSNTHVGQFSRVKRRKKIQKKSIYKALLLGATALSEVEKAGRILHRYGEGGTSPAQAVINRIQLVEDPPSGARILYNFLVKWDKDHTKN
ncbi:hypothetical protein B0H17DRAFT_1137953 [Mycena rosella]|uniref:Uncharacterized protein n=1 Tax=Mycena rosella TaxID=1033263 RepID=A0AAD7D7A8_MYCRO|nr:hypothetical protein B0H17DRAFT_1137953 [Mycena rosella]